MVVTAVALATSAVARAGAGVEENGDMVWVPPQSAATVGSSSAERTALAVRFDCTPTWLNDDLDQTTLSSEGFWIDRHPVTNAEYELFVRGTGAQPPWHDGSCPPELRDHPVVNVPQYAAAAYAAWAGKRLPTAAEWEIASRSAGAGLFPWGDDWPGPVMIGAVSDNADDGRPITGPVCSGRHGRSAVGMEDFIQQVCEWTGTSQPHHGTLFFRVRGTSGLHRDPVNFRTAAASTAMMSFSSPLIGFRCARDAAAPTPKRANTGPSDAADQRRTGSSAPPPGKWAPTAPAVFAMRDAPPAVRARLSDWNLRFIGDYTTDIAANSRGFLLVAPALGASPVCLFLGESVMWSGRVLLAGLRRSDPPLVCLASLAGVSRYRLELEPIALEFEFRAGDDCIDLVTTITNRTQIAGQFFASSCFGLNNQPRFYDPDMRRTYLWTRDAGFVLMRKLPRPGECVRWIQPSDLSAFGGSGSPGMMAVVSDDGDWTFASARFAGAVSYHVGGNTWLNCLHTDAAVEVPAGATRRTWQRLYFLHGGIDALQRRAQTDAATLERN